MSIVKSDNDKMPDEAIEDRANTYQGMMDMGYVYGLPISLGIVMFIALILMGVGLFNPMTWIISFLTWLGVLGFSKTFFVH